MILRFKEFQFCLELVIFYLLQLQALSLIFLLYHLITQEYVKKPPATYDYKPEQAHRIGVRLTPIKSGMAHRRGHWTGAVGDKLPMFTIPSCEASSTIRKKIGDGTEECKHVFSMIHSNCFPPMVG